MQADTAVVGDERAANGKPKRQRRPRPRPRLLMLTDLDRRTGIYRAVADEIAAIESDLTGGCADRLSTAERAIIADACLAGAMVQDIGTRWLKGEEVEVGDLATLANVRRRNLAEVGIRRQPRPVAELGIRDIIAEHEAKTVEGAAR